MQTDRRTATEAFKDFLTDRSLAKKTIWVFESKEEEYLDPNDMAIKSRITPNFTSHDLIEGWIDNEIQTWGVSFEKVRENQTVLPKKGIVNVR